MIMPVFTAGRMLMIMRLSTGRIVGLAWFRGHTKDNTPTPLLRQLFLGHRRSWV